MSLPTISTVYQTVLFSCGVFVVAGVLEEITHAAAARPWAVQQDIRFSGVTTEVPQDTSRKVDIWISFAPCFVGLVALAGLYLGVGIPPLSHKVQLAIAGWGYFTMPSLVDLQQAAGADIDEREPLVKPARRGVQLYCLGFVLMFGGDELGVFLLGQPTRTVAPGVFEPPITAITIASACLWIGAMVSIGATVILVHTANNQQKMRMTASE
jgi:hypothetical protein